MTSLTQAERTLMVRPDGGLTWIPSSKLADAQRDGYDVAPESDVRREREIEEYGSAEVRAALAGAARGVTFGGSDWALTKTGVATPEALRKLQEYNPNASIAGEVIGTLAPLLVTGGAGAAGLALKGAGAGVRGVAAAGRGVTAATRAALPAARTLTGRVARDAVAHAAGATVEGAAYGLGHAISEAAIGDPDETAEKLIGDAGLTAVLSGVGGGVFGGVGTLASHALKGKSLARLWSKQQALDAGGDAVAAAQGPLPEQQVLAAGEEAAAAAQKPVPKGLAEALEDDAKGILGAADEADKRWTSVLEEELKGKVPEKILWSMSRLGKEARKRADDHHTIRSKHVRDMVETGRKAEKTADQLFDLEAKGKPKRRHIEKLVKRSAGKWGEAEDRAIGAVRQALDKIDNGLADWEQMPDYRVHGDPLIKQVGRLLDGYRGQMKKVVGRAAMDGDKQQLNSELFALIDQFKRDFGKRIAGSGTGVEGSLIRNLQDIVYKQTLQPLLESEAVWGKMGIAQAKVNKAWSTFLDNKPVYDSAFSMFAGKESFAKQFQLSTDKMHSHLSKVGTVGADDYAVFFKRNLDAEKNLVDAIEEFYELDPAIWGDRIATYRDANTKMRSIYSQAETDMSLANARAAIRRGEYPEMITASLLSGPIGTRLADTALGGISAVEQVAEKYGSKIGGSVSGYMSKAQDLARKGAITVSGKPRAVLVPTTAAVLNGTVFGPKKRTKKQDKLTAYKDRLGELSLYQSSPDALTDRLKTNTEGLPPAIAQAVYAKAQTAAQYLWQTAPKDPRPQSVFTKRDYVPPNSELDAWARRVEVAQNPMKALDHLRNRTLTTQHVETLREIYPRIYEQVVKDVMQRAAKIGDELPYADRVQLSLLFGVPIEPSVAPVVVQAYQGMYQPLEPSGGGSGGGGGGGNLTLAERSQTQGQRIEKGL